MKRIVLSASVLLLTVSFAFAQVPSEFNRPYRNLEMWYGTQSAPEPLEKARWALDDINAYRTAKGLVPFSESILDQPNIVQPRRAVFRNIRNRR